MIKGLSALFLGLILGVLGPIALLFGLLKTLDTFEALWARCADWEQGDCQTATMTPLSSV